MTFCPAGVAEVEMAELYVKPGEHPQRARDTRNKLCPPPKLQCSLFWVPGLISHISSPSQAIRNVAGTTRRSSPTGCRPRLVDPNVHPLPRGLRLRRMDPLEVREGCGWNPIRKDGLGINLSHPPVFPFQGLRKERGGIQ